MCGIAGVLALDGSTPELLSAVVLAMASTLTHRGPDAGTVWTDAETGIALGHRRLSIIDLSEHGAQPMQSASGRYVISYNGEVYNADAIATELRSVGRQFAGHCDTEVLVEAIDEWGVTGALERVNGMFVFAVWDRVERKLHLVRDRLGEKPLYYGWFGNTLLFGSELKALRAHPAFRGEVDRDAIGTFLRRGCVPSPRSIYSGVFKLPPATVLTVDAQSRSPRTTDPVSYWSITDAFERRATMTDTDAVDTLEELLLDATKLRMRSDVPLGAFLSGGIDSTAVVALMQAQSPTSVRTFTIGSTAHTHNEADRAAEIARHLQTRHTELIVTPADALAVIPRLPTIYDEPFADSSQIPTLVVSELARKDVTVSLSGDGGDEVFGGYNRYRWVPRVASGAARVPKPVRSAAARALGSVPPGYWDALSSPLPGRFRPSIPGTKLAKLSAIVPLGSAEAMYHELASHWDDPGSVVLGLSDTADTNGSWGGDDIVNRMMALDTATYLPDDILVKLDRATMSVSLEGRIPLLDHRVVEFMAALPSTMKIRDGQTKWLLRRVLDRYVPSTLTSRPKSGFGVPIGEWLRGPLRPWADDLLSTTRLRRDGYLRPEPVRAMWEQHLSRRRDWGDHLWDVLMFQAWLDAWSNP